MVPMLRTRWRPGPAASEPGPHLISFTKFRVVRRRELPGVYRAALGLRREWDQLEGAIGVWLWSQPLRGSAGSISLWRDEAALRGFVGWAPHVEVVRRYRDGGSLLALSWRAERAGFATHWAQARQRHVGGDAGVCGSSS
jgi:hypothetical protein